VNNRLWEDILAQGDNLGRVVDHLLGPEAASLQRAAHFLKNGKPTVFIGMGSAAYLSMPAEGYLGRRGYPAMVLNASDALYTYWPTLAHANVVLNTRSGKTVEQVKLAERLVAADLPFVTITNEPESPVAQMATHVVWTNTRKDDLVSINIVTAMMTATLLLVAEVVGETEGLQPTLAAIGDRMDETVAHATARADELAEPFAPIRPVYLLHRGLSKGAACCGRLVLEEVARTPGVTLEVGEFRQGPVEVVDDRFGAVVFVPDGEVGDLTRTFIRSVRSGEGHVLAVGFAEDLQTLGEDTSVFSIPPVPAILRPVFEVVPTQLLAYKLAEYQGYEPGTVRYLPKVITSETAIPNLTP
jgi:glucosamine--fructose-6-phosphate aminotransferase (isomerizing)